MNEPAHFDLVDDAREFFAPVDADLVDGLVGQYETMRCRIESLSSRMADADTQSALHYFLEGNRSADRRFDLPKVDQLFQLEPAVAELNAAYWSKALQLTDVLDTMPQARRDDWNKQIQNPMGTKRDRYAQDWIIAPLPDFTEDTVRATLQGLVAQRGQFLAERVDGIFRGLSGEHVTNAPEGFGKRMIIAHLHNEYYSTNHGRAGLINDLRAVIAKFMGRDEPKWNATSGLLDTLKCRWGEWVTVDGGAMRIRVYKKGTAHMEVHPDMAWRLNMVLAHMHPLAIPAEFRQRPTKKTKDIKPMQRPLPFAVIEVLTNFKRARDGRTWSLGYSYASENKAAKAEAVRIIEGIGGAQTSAGSFEFGYDPTEAVRDIIASGCIPDQVSHQFYPTPANLAQRVVELADIGDSHTVLEPSAGQGGLAELLPKDRTTCVEFSGLHVKVLQAKGFTTVWNDFLPWADNRASEGLQFDRVVMNPPFDQGRWQAHTEHAARLVAPGGRLVAILPSGAAKRLDLGAGWDMLWTLPIDNAFPGVSVSVVILTATRQK